jgi:Flp pilus assembly protein TadD, contains TPR repeats
MERFFGKNMTNADQRSLLRTAFSLHRLPISKVATFLSIAIGINACAVNQEQDSTAELQTEQSSTFNFESETHEHVSNEHLTKLLEAEFLLQREGPGAAYDKFATILRSEKSPAMAKRVTNIAIASQNPAYIEESTNLWISIDPKAEEPYPLQLQIYFASGRYKQASELISRALEHDVSLQFLPTFLDQHSREVDTLETVRLALDELPKGALKNIYLQLSNNRLDFFSGHYTAVEAAIIDNLFETAPKTECKSLYVILGYSQNQLGKTEAAIETLLKGLNDFPNSKHLLIPVIELLVADNQLTRASELYNNAKLSSFDQTQLGLTFAGKLLEHHHYDNALSVLNSLPEKQYGFQDQTKLLTADALNKLGKPIEALNTLKTVDGPLAWNATQQIIRLLYTLKRENEINALVFERLNEEKLQEETMSVAGLHEYNKRPDLSLEFINTVLEAHPNADAIRYKKAILLESLDQWEAAIAELKKLVDSSPDNPQYLNALGYTILVNSNDLELAQNYIEKAYAIDNDDPAIIDSLGWVLFLRDDLDQATFYLQKAWELLKDAEIGAHYGETLWRQGHQSLANDIWRKAYQITPEYPVLMETLNRLNPDLITELQN